MSQISALKEKILNVLDELGETYAEIAVDSDPEVTEGQMSTLSDLVERLDTLVNRLPEETESASGVIPIHPTDCDPITNYP